MSFAISMLGLQRFFHGNIRKNCWLVSSYDVFCAGVLPIFSQVFIGFAWVSRSSACVGFMKITRLFCRLFIPERLPTGTT